MSKLIKITSYIVNKIRLVCRDFIEKNQHMIRFTTNKE